MTPWMGIRTRPSGFKNEHQCSIVYDEGKRSMGKDNND